MLNKKFDEPLLQLKNTINIHVFLGLVHYNHLFKNYYITCILTKKDITNELNLLFYTSLTPLYKD